MVLVRPAQLLSALLLAFLASFCVDYIALFLPRSSPLLPWASIRLPAYLLPKAIASIYFFAFYSGGCQVVGLVGPRGLIPVTSRLKTLNGVAGNKKVGWLHRYLAVFSVHALGDGSPLRLRLICMTGSFLAITVLAVNHHLVTALLLATCYLLYYTLKHAMGVFFNLQWDSLLLESGLRVAVLAAARGDISRTACMWLVQVLLFRLMFGSGVVKLASRDPSWSDLTAMSFHFWTQPLPGMLAPLFHSLPLVVTKLMTLTV